MVGKDVTFSVLYTTQGNREFGLVTLPEGESLLEVLVSEGMVKVRDDAEKRDDDSANETLIGKLRIFEDMAKDAGKGIWGNPSESVVTNYEHPMDGQEILDQIQGKAVEGIVERIISGDKYVVRLFLGPKEHQQLVVLLAGIRCPATTRKDAYGLIIPSEEYGDEAKDYVEARLLQRTVKITALGLSPNKQVIVSISHPAGNIAGLLLSQGFGRCFDAHINLLGGGMAELRDAEKYAKQHNLRLYKSHVVKKKDSNNEFDAQVARIMNADTIVVRNKGGVERKINLSSVRQPK